MNKKLKSYTMNCQFWGLDVSVKAKNKTEARKKIMQKLAKKNPVTFMNKKNSYLDEND